MALDKLVDSSQLDTDLTSVANAIRAKSGGSGQLAFPSGFVSEIGNISGEEYYRASRTGCIYPKVLDETLENYNANTYGSRRWGYCSEMTEATIRGMTALSNMVGPVFQTCEKLKKIIIPDASGNNNSYIASYCPAAEVIQIGSVGHAMTSIYSNAFSGCTQSGLTITIYVNASSLADVPSNVKDRSPFGATNAEIVYRSSTTGEVITA